ncbi:hypothetical protein KAR91_68450, partial [Candidatus Pacearchaeota archaeon]|nr:hypothetical protein [Candidatus Pacearchaeota archaeon]
HDNSTYVTPFALYDTASVWADPYVILNHHPSNLQIRGVVRSPTTSVIASSSASVINGETYTHRLRHRVATAIQIQTINGTIDGIGTPPTDSLGILDNLGIGVTVDGAVGDGTHIYDWAVIGH